MVLDAKIVRKDLYWVFDTGRYRSEFAVSATMEGLWDSVGGALDGAVVRYGNRVLFARCLLDGVIAAVYEFVDDDRNCDSRLGLIWLGGSLYRDAGSALEGCMRWCRYN